MAKDVDLRKRVVPQTTAAPQKPERADPSGLRIPPAAQAPRRGMPLAPGQVIRAGASNQPAMTPMELAALTQMGWKPGDPIPESIPPEIAAIATQIRDEALRPMPPIDPNTPRTKLEVVDIAQTSPQKQAEVRQVLKDAADYLRRPQDPPVVSKAPAAAPVAEEDVTIASQAIPGWTPPGDPGYKPAIPTYPDLRRKPAKPVAPEPEPVANEPTDPLAALGISPEQLEDTDQLIVELPTTRGAQPQVQAPVAAAPEEQPSATGATPTLTDCPHCGWQLHLPDIAEPSYGEKQSFLQSILGQKPYIRDYELLGGALTVRFRTLTVKEIDVIYHQVFLERERGTIQTIDDYWERINRYRLYLQTCQVATSTFRHDLPDGYSQETNPFAEAHWQFDPPEDPRETGLPIIETYFVEHVLNTEHLNRSVNNQCLRFNRLVARLEALMDNSDFWKPTGEQS